MAYEINYNDERFQKVEAEKNQALKESEKLYGDMINNSDKYYQAQIDASKEWAETQQKNQQAQTDFAIEKIEQQKDQAHKDYLKEQKGAYGDWQRESNRYGANAEQMAAQGLSNSGYSESSQVAMYTAYQNRVATARASFDQTKLNYDNAIKDAILQNNSILAEIAYKAQQQQLELSLQGFQYKNQLLLEKANKKTEISNTFWSRYQDVLSQINTENALQEEVRQFNANHAVEQARIAEDARQFNASLAWEKEQYAKEQSGGRLSSGLGSGAVSAGVKAAQRLANSSKGSGNVTDGSNLPIDMDSLNKCAKWFGKQTFTADQVDQLVRNGILKDDVVNGRVVFSIDTQLAKTRYLPQAVKKVFGIK